MNINKLAIGSLSLVLMSAFGMPIAVAEMKEENPDTRIEKYEQRTETDGSVRSEMEETGSDSTTAQSESDPSNSVEIPNEEDPSEAVEIPTEELIEPNEPSYDKGQDSMMQSESDPSDSVEIPNEEDPSEAVEIPTEELIEPNESSYDNGQDSMMQSESDPSDSVEIPNEEDPSEAVEIPTEELIEPNESDTDSNSSSSRETEAFSLVSSAYRGQYEPQGIDGYAVMLNNYNTGELTAEKLIQAGIDAGDLSPQALEDEAYVNAVELQLDTLRDNG